jgi:small subunit ribosomal protein S20
MAQHESAKKRHRQSLKRAARNRHWRSTIRRAVRRARAAASQGAENAVELVHTAERLLRKGASKGVLHKKTASRSVSRLQKATRRSH